MIETPVAELAGLGAFRAERRGRVEQYRSDEGLGIVREDSGARYLFHCTAIANGTREIDDGALVRFVLALGAVGWIEASAISKITPKARDARPGY